MKHENEIDQIFRDGLEKAVFSNQDAAWAAMEKSLEEDQRRRRPILWITFSAMLLVLLFGWFFSSNSTDQPVSAKAPVVASHSSSVVAVNSSSTNKAAPTPNNHSIVPTSGKAQAANAQQSLPLQKKTINRPTILIDNFANNYQYELKPATEIHSNFSSPQYAKPSDNLVTERFLEVLSILQPSNKVLLNTALSAGNIRKPALDSLRDNKPVLADKAGWSVDVLAGSDVFRLNKQLGYFGGIRISRHLDKSTSISVGLSYTSNSVNEQYRLSNKPAQQTEADAQLNHITTLRLPVYFQRQLPRSKWGLMVGLVPTYIMDATVYNVPNSFTGDPSQYRRFTINDINRFNILFGAGVQYKAFKRLSFELSGSYGFTGLVKNSYINQSRVNDNFRNIQAGLVYRLR